MSLRPRASAGTRTPATPASSAPTSRRTSTSRAPPKAAPRPFRPSAASWRKASRRCSRWRMQLQLRLIVWNCKLDFNPKKGAPRLRSCVIWTWARWPHLRHQKPLRQWMPAVLLLPTSLAKQRLLPKQWPLPIPRWPLLLWSPSRRPRPSWTRAKPPWTRARPRQLRGQQQARYWTPPGPWGLNQHLRPCWVRARPKRLRGQKDARDWTPRKQHARDWRRQALPRPSKRKTRR
mmetsp:Transcript_116570/g.341147  ORF Transcript_116570/g.341147 Transcript_116570/m.341147 type:complete len:233 (+) Transcript_116570:268-966(+)